MREATDVERSVPLLERETELELIGSLIEDVTDGGGRTLVVEGPAGIGKTELLRSARPIAEEAGIAVLFARGAELEREFAFGVARQLLEPAIASATASELDRLFEGAARHSSAVIGDGVPEAIDDAFVVIHALYWLVVNLAVEGPLLVALDDAHWSDDLSLRFLAYLVHRVEGMAVGVLIATRSDEPGAGRRLLDEISFEPSAATLRPGPLSEAASARVVRDSLGESAAGELSAACHEATGGNPLLLAKLMRSVREDEIDPTAEGAKRIREFGPATISRSMLARLARIGSAAEALARALTVLGPDAELTHAAAVAGVDRPEGAAAASVLGRAQVLAPGARLRFAHPIVGAAIAAEMSPYETEALHRRAARVLADAEAAPDRVAAHLLKTEPAGEEWAVEALRHAARKSSSSGAHAIAATYLGRALAEPPPPILRARVLGERGLARARSSEGGEAEDLTAAIAAMTNPTEAAEAALAASVPLVAQGEFDEAAALCELALGAGGGIDDSTRARLEAELFVAGGLTASWARPSAERLERLRGEILEYPSLLAARSLLELRRAGSAADARELLDRAMADGAILSEPTSVLAALTTMLLVTEEFEQAERGWSAMITLIGQRGSRVMAAVTHAWRGLVRLRAGAISAALEDLAPLLGLEGYAATPWHWEASAHLIDAAIETGDRPLIDRTLAKSEIPDELPGELVAAVLNDALARLELVRGNPDAAIARLREASVRWADLDLERGIGLTRWRTDLAFALSRAGARDESVELANEAVRLAEGWGAPGRLGMTRRVAALVRSPEDPVEGLREAVETLEHSGARLEHAKALTDLGAALRRRGHRKDAREHLRPALDLAHRLGGRMVAERAREELVATGARPRRLVLSGVDSLTPSELRVARLAAEGKANRRIAQELYVTERTVESHMRHVLGKLEIDSRQGLPEALAAEAK